MDPADFDEFYLTARLLFLCRGVVEYDAVGFTKLTLLLMWKDFCFLVHGEPETCNYTHIQKVLVAITGQLTVPQNSLISWLQKLELSLY